MSLIGGTFQKKIKNEEKTLKKTILGMKEKPDSLIKESSEPKNKQIMECPVTQGTGRILTSGKLDTQSTPFHNSLQKQIKKK